jgi:hypothetical protein
MLFWDTSVFATVKPWFDDEWSQLIDQGKQAK